MTTRKKARPYPKTDAMSEEIVAALLAQPSLAFDDLFRAVHEGLRARQAANGGEDTLRLRLHVKMQDFAKQGIVQKTGRIYLAREAALRQCSTEQAAARERARAWKAAGGDEKLEP